MLHIDKCYNVRNVLKCAFNFYLIFFRGTIIGMKYVPSFKKPVNRWEILKTVVFNMCMKP